MLFLIRLYFLKRYISLLRRMDYYIYPILLSTKKLLKNPQTLGGKLSNHELRLLYCGMVKRKTVCEAWQLIAVMALYRMI